MEQQIHGVESPPVAGLFAREAAIGDLRHFRFSQAHPNSAAIPSTSAKSSRAVASRDLHSPLQLAADTLVVVVLGVGAGIGYQLLFRGALGRVDDFAFTALTVALLCIGIERLFGLRPALVTTGFDRLRRHVQVWTLAFASLLFFIFALKAGGQLSRGAVFLFYILGLPLVGIWRVLAPPWLARIANHSGYAARDCIVIGDVRDPLLDKFVDELSVNCPTPPTVMKFHTRCEKAAWQQELQLLTEQTIAKAHGLRHGEIYLCAGATAAERLSDIERALRILPRAIYVVPDAQTASLVRCRPASIGSQIAVEVRREPLDCMQRAVKRAGDILFASLAFIFAAPLLALVAVAIKLDSAGPVLFRQTRNGYRGRPFKILKFRTMHVQEDGPVIRQACRRDARVTRVGRFLRKSSIDELPQLFNVLMGHMSLVGPRPHAQAHDELYARQIQNYEVRQHVKPGITGWAQIHGLRGETATVEQMYRRIEFDLWYAVNASLLLDAEILVRTFFEVFRHRNAY